MQYQNANLETILGHIHQLGSYIRIAHFCVEVSEDTRQSNLDKALSHGQAILDNNLLGLSEPQRASWYAVEEDLKHQLGKLSAFQINPKLNSDEFFYFALDCIQSALNVLEAGIMYWMDEDCSDYNLPKYVSRR